MAAVNMELTQTSRKKRQDSCDTTLQTQELICIEVEQRPWLYDNSRGDYKDTIKRDNAWEAIGRMVSMSATDCQKAWRGIRNRYARELRSTESKRSGMGAGEVYQSSWPLFKTLEFLKEFIKQRRTKKLPAPAPMQPVHGSMLAAIPADGQDRTPPLYQTGTTALGVSNNEAGLLLSCIETDIQDGSPCPEESRSAAEACSSQSGSRCPRPHLDVDDEETMFLLSLRKTLKSFDAKKRRLAQMRIQQLMFELEFGE
ncbi:uncharacterized protein LOC135374555 [Ornithodoros turicata]|uniref:uncharacterized protein LOC135374555 n=1 Tax=Ornithodoros turicata TaxID=34597 RepID=UPI003138E918